MRNVGYKGDVEGMALRVLHVMVHLATVEQREDDKRGRGGESPCQRAMRVSRLPRAINGDLLQSKMWKHHSTTLGSGV